MRQRGTELNCRSGLGDGCKVGSLGRLTELCRLFVERNKGLPTVFGGLKSVPCVGASLLADVPRILV